MLAGGSPLIAEMTGAQAALADPVGV